MTLCILYKDENNNIHIASDSRLSMSKNSYTDVGIKVISIPYRIHNPTENNITTIAYEGEFAMCYAGSTLNALILKESIIEILKNLQFIPGKTSLTLNNIAKIVFKVYKNISRKITETSVGENGVASIYLAGKLEEDTTYRAFEFLTNLNNEHSYKEILISEKYFLAGSGKGAAEEYLSEVENINLSNLLLSLKHTIDNTDINDVGGSIQYGKFQKEKFVTYGILELSKNYDVHYFRASLDLNSKEFSIGYNDFFLSYQYIDPFKNDS